jgi:hypothetical protein
MRPVSDGGDGVAVNGGADTPHQVRVGRNWAVGAAIIDETGKLVYSKEGHRLVNTAGGGIDIYTEQVFADCRVEVEVMVPKGSNSGIYLLGRYEVQILDSFGVKTLGTGDMGAIFSVAPPR